MQNFTSKCWAKPGLVLVAGASLLLTFTLSGRTAPEKEKYTRVLYLNFDGVTLRDGDWNPLTNTAKMPLWKSHPEKAVIPPYTPPCKTDADCREGSCSVEMPQRGVYKYNPFNEKPFKRCSERDIIHEKQVVFYASKTLADFNVKVVRERPSSGDYDMLIFNYNSTIGSPHGGSAGLSCNNKRGNMIMFVQDSRWGHGSKNLAKIVTHEFGHSMGMSHSTKPPGSACPMNGDAFGQPWVKYLDQCVPVDHVGYCAKFQARHCRHGQQNTYKIALEHLGKARVKPELVFPGDEGVIVTKFHGKKAETGKPMTCKNSVLKGIEWRFGMIIDGIRGICDNNEKTGVVGTDTGQGPQQFVCHGKNNQVSQLEAWAFGHGGAIDHLRVTCSDGQQSGIIGGWDKKGRLQSPALQCPAGSKAIGLKGNRGGWLNSLALVCRSSEKIDIDGLPDLPQISKRKLEQYRNFKID